jgi:hypothetical protein
MAFHRSVGGAVSLGNRAQNPQAKNDEDYQKRQALEADGWALWEKVCTTIKERCSGLNAEYGKEVITSQRDRVGALSARLSIAGSVSKLSASFDAASLSCALQWFYSGPAGRMSADGRCRLYVHKGTLAFQANATPYTAEAVAKQMFDGLLSE